jgi:hypothetical protein
MAPPTQSKDRRPKHFEWKTIRIPYSSVYFIGTVILVVLVVGALVFYRKELNLARIPRALVAMITGSGGGGPGEGPREGETVEQRFASLSMVDGDVKVQRANDMEWIGAEKKMKLATGDRVRTFGGSSAEVLFDDGSILRIKPDSLIIIGDLTEDVRTKVRQSSVKLMVSNIEADIKKSVVEGSQFRLEMPTAVAEVNKAKLSVEVGPSDESKVKVYNGNVAVDTGTSRVALTDASQVAIGAGRTLSPVSKLVAPARLTTPRNLFRFIVNDPARFAVPLRWDPVTRATGYHLQIDPGRDFLKPVLNRRDIRTTEYRAEGLPQGIYYARVAALDSNGLDGGFSDPVVFKILRDNLPPEVSIVKFVSSRASGGYDIFLEGTTEPTATLSLGGRMVVVDAQGKFAATLRGIPGSARDLLLVARDPAGNEKVQTLKVSGG